VIRFQYAVVFVEAVECARLGTATLDHCWLGESNRGCCAGKLLRPGTGALRKKRAGIRIPARIVPTETAAGR